MGIADMPQISLRIASILLLLAALFVVGALACGSDGDSGSSGATGGSGAAESGGTSPAPTAPPAQPTATPETIEAGEADEATGIRVDEVGVEPKGLGGKAVVLISNVLDEECTGPVISIDLLNADGGLVAEMGIEASGPLPAGEQKSYEQIYFGSKVAEARVAAITCENSAARHGAPQSPTKKDLETESESK